MSLGYIRHLCTDPDTLTVVSADLRPKSLSWGLAASENLLLDTFCQIGDVVLVHDEGALDFVPQDATTGFLDLIGCPVLSSAGAQLGKVCKRPSAVMQMTRPHCQVHKLMEDA